MSAVVQIVVCVVLSTLAGAGVWAWRERAEARRLERIRRSLSRAWHQERRARAAEVAYEAARRRREAAEAETEGEGVA